MYDIWNQTNVRKNNGFQSFICLLLLPQTLNLMVAVQKKPLYINYKKFMYKIGNMNRNLCTFCENVEETMYHLLLEFPKVYQILTEFVSVSVRVNELD